MNKAVLLVTFNRKDYLEKSFAAVAAAKPPRLYLASDGPRPGKKGEAEVIDDIRKWMLAHVDWPCEVKTRFLEKNSGGCGPGVSGAITWFFQNEKDGIIVEDDCIPSPTFFELCEECLDKYAEDKRVWSVCGNAPFPTKVKASYFFARLSLCWGWATWADRWSEYDIKKWKYDDRIFESVSKYRQVRDYYVRIMNRGAAGLIETWDYQWSFLVFAHKGLCVIPKENLVSNCGLVGVHYSISEDDALANRLNTPVSHFKCIVHPGKVKLDRKNSERIFIRHICSIPPFGVRMRQKAYRILAVTLKSVLPDSLVGKIRKMRQTR